MTTNILKYIICIEVPKLAIPRDYSLKIQIFNEIFYLYPDLFISSLNTINSEISKLMHISTYQRNTYQFNAARIEKNKETFTYIFSKIDINLNIEVDNIYSKVYEYFKPLILIFELFLSEIFEISTIYIFKRVNYGYKFIRMIKQSKFHRELSKQDKIKQFISIEDVEYRFSKILAKFCNKQKYLECIEEYFTGKYMSFYETDKIAHSWNSLEHLAHMFCNDKDLNKIVNDRKLGLINRTISDVLNFLNESDVIFPNLDINQIRSGNLLRLKNDPPILNKVFYLCDKLNLRLTQDEENIIKIVYFIRNKLFHETQYIMHYAKHISRKYNLPSFNYRDLGQLSIKFSLLVERIFLKFFRIIPYHFNLIKKELYHILVDKSFIIPYLKKKRDQDKQQFHLSLQNTGLTQNQSDLKELIYEKKKLLSNGKYLNLIKFLERFKQRFYKSTHEHYIPGLLKSKNRMLEVDLIFREELNGDLNFIFGNKIQIQKLMREDIKFQSLYNEVYNNFGIEFDLIITTFSTVLSADSEYQKIPLGKFLTLKIDIKEIEPDSKPFFLEYLDLYI